MTATLPENGRPEPGARPLVEIRGLDVGYARRREVTPAVIGLDLRIDPGEIVAVVGESGSGKTTTANAVIGLLPAGGRITAGSAVIDGVETAGATERALRPLRGRVVGLVPQDPMVGLNPTRRVGAQIGEAVKLRGVRGPAVGAEVLELLGQAGVPEPELRARQYPHELSGGLRQRVLIAIALAGRPKLIIADEPTSALDVTVEKRILDHLTGLVREQGISLLLITHDLAVAADRADRVVVMRDGRIVEQGDPRVILGSPREDYTRQLIAAAPGLAHGGRVVPRFDVRDQPAPEPILTLTGVSKTFGAGDARRGQRGFNALDGVTLSVPRGRTHALVGESGCGKTTTLRIALGLEAPTSGSVVLDGTEIAGLSWGGLRPLRRKAQIVHQNPFAALDPKFTIKQSIIEPLVAMRVGDRRGRHLRAKELLDQVALPASYLDRLPTELSGGQRQRVAIARALAPSPDLLMLDEPVSALDVSVQEQILRLLTDLQTELGLSYLFVSHDLAVVAEISHTVSVMSRGRVVEEGPVAEVFTNPRSPHTRELIDAIPGQRTAAWAGNGKETLLTANGS
ncbi:ABC transporter ATP-binding protein [Frankia sp. CNm7]|uniref:ABC transporter ATP-binding protein n=1 Tax=Frankia nepalensis TaxID=1836974 RepID=A0A937UTH0_9ACTN|nr:ABC transporter ATP-binding protein [Frankia nepalensis]MBL7499832.1 ABC transporter ATP-binding protein [Frankia nepalensis]MBL7513649.1 ABC transporter ATP-binding protein [Frankia nepalensis]MBL7519538.1 ABC transporter ATP-binding protein [Frankia nepalensis]MBL7631260.1 ABC transporter ATP-binding protein [Frankia nepalensis]